MLVAKTLVIPRFGREKQWAAQLSNTLGTAAVYTVLSTASVILLVPRRELDLFI